MLLRVFLILLCLCLFLCLFVLLGSGNEPQWCVVGDTFPVGCAFSDKIVYPEFLKENPDYHNSKFNTKYGVYTPNCGLDNVHFSWGHDEYMYQVCVHNGCKIPPYGLAIIRFILRSEPTTNTKESI